MPLSYTQYLGDGATKVFNLSFAYIHRDHVFVSVDGVNKTFTWLSATQVQLNPAPAIGAVIDVRRKSPRDKLLVDFKDASTLVESDLDLSALHSFFLAQETLDLGEASLGVTQDGSFDALLRKISNVQTPTANRDAVNKEYVDTGVASGVSIATGKAAEATTQAQAAAGSATTAATRAAEALASQKAAATSVTTAKGHRDQTALDRAATAADRVQTGLDRVATGEDRAATAGFAAAAAASAEQAKLFDPADFYNRTQANTQFAAKSTTYTKTAADAAFVTKTSLTTTLGSYASTTALTNGLNGRLSTNGGTLKGGLYVTPAGNAFIELRSGAGEAYIDFTNNGETRDYHWRVISRNDGNFQFSGFNGAGFTFQTDGNIWTSGLGWLTDKFAEKNAQVQHNSAVWEFGQIVAADGWAQTADCPAPWVLVGLRSNGARIYLRAVWLRNN